MCSIGEDDFGDDGGVHAMVPDIVESKNEVGQCKKCLAKNVPVFKLFFRDFECKECFLINARHKFRATLGSSKILPRDARVLLVFDGSDVAEVLLDMLYYAQTQNNFKRLHCTVKILYIDDSLLKESGKNEKSEYDFSALKNHLQSYPAFESYLAPISNNQKPVTFELKNLEAYLKRSKEAEYDFFKQFERVRSLTSRQDLLKYQKNRLATAIANKLDCPYIFMPDISTNLATQLLTAIALGRGGSAAYDVALVDDRLGDNVKIIRPLRDLNQPEIDLYVRIRSLRLLKTNEDYGINSGPSASLQNLTRSFVENLQGNYSSTVSTVFRCCDKIAPKNNLNRKMSLLSISSVGSQENDTNVENLDYCSFCGSPISASSCNTLLAIEFSRIVSEKGATPNDCLKLDSEARKNLIGSNKFNSLCHACQNIENDNSNRLFKFKS